MRAYRRREKRWKKAGKRELIVADSIRDRYRQAEIKRQLFSCRSYSSFCCVEAIPILPNVEAIPVFHFVAISPKTGIASTRENWNNFDSLSKQFQQPVAFN